ncbi:MAG TPA: hypothetical protein VFN67_20025 [Polyangiales bacterium]|nr:hypothetical protein [Polyangiales bacterium]
MQRFPGWGDRPISGAVHELVQRYGRTHREARRLLGKLRKMVRSNVIERD